MKLRLISVLVLSGCVYFQTGCRAETAHTVCDVLSRADSFHGKTVALQSEVLMAGLSGSIAISDTRSPCDGVIALITPENTTLNADQKRFLREQSVGGYYDIVLSGRFESHPNGLPAGRQIKGTITVDRVIKITRIGKNPAPH